MDFVWVVVFLLLVYIVYVGEEGGGGWVYGVFWILLFWGCKEGWLLIFFCNLCNIDDSCGLCYVGDFII